MTAKRKSEKPSGNPAGVHLAEVERLLEFMNEHGLEEFEYANGDLRIRLKKAGHYSPAPMVMAQRAPEIVVAGTPAASSEPAREAPPEAGRGEDLHIVKSPIVGTYYESPSPGAEAFVKVGDQVQAGQVLCIIEAMKLMNEIESDVAGEIAKMYVQNGQPVEYGESLFAIRPARKK